MKIKELREQIERQKEINVILYKSIPLASHEDPNNEKAEPILKEWRKGSKNLKRMIKELQELEMKSKSAQSVKENKKTFVNGFGEATKRYITTQTCESADKRNQKEILSFIGIN